MPDKRNAVYRIQEMLKDKKGQVITQEQLRTLIMTQIGSTEATIYSTMRIIGELGLIKDIGNWRFEIK